MCTAISWKKTDHYFGRNLDLEYSYHETVTVCPRNFVFRFRNGTVRKQNYAMIGMAYVQNQYPLFYEATNEKGLSMAGLHFVGNAYYPEVEDLKKSVAPFELIPWVLSQCETCDDAERLLKGKNVEIFAVALDDFRCRKVSCRRAFERWFAPDESSFGRADE